VPIIAATSTIPPTTPPGGGTDLTWEDSRRLLLSTMDATDGQVFIGDEWVIMPGMTGMGLPPVNVATQQAPGLDGAWLREITIGPREVFLPLFIGSNSGHVDYLARLDRLQTFLDPRAVTDPSAVDGTVLLIAQSLSGTRQLAVAYLDGMQGDEGQSAAGTFWATFGVKLLAVDPWWRDADQTVLEFGVGSGGPFLAADGSGDVWPRALAPSVSAGVGMPITVDGRVPVWPTIEVDGPATSVTVSSDAGTNVQIGTVDLGETLTLITDPRHRSCRVAGVKAWDRVAAAPQFRPLTPGENTLAVEAPGADDDTTRIRLRWHPGWQSAW
jgi:Phage tail protein